MTNDAERALEIQNLLLNLLRGFYWFDEGLQNYLKGKGWPEVSRPQSMVMSNVVMGVTRPSEIARRLGISRQAVHATIKAMQDIGMVTLAPAPGSKRNKIVVLTELGEAMRKDAQAAMRLMTEELCGRLGEAPVRAMAAALHREWGLPVTFSKAPDAAAGRRSSRRSAA